MRKAPTREEKRADPRDAERWGDVEEAAELLQEERFEEALIELKRVLEADSQNPYAYQFLGVAFFELGRLEAAEDAHRAAVKVSPDYLGARVALSNVLRLLKKTKEAEREAREALRRFPGDGDAQYALGLALAAQGRRPEARRSFEGYLNGNPEFEAAQEVRQILEMLGLGDDDEPFELD